MGSVKKKPSTPNRTLLNCTPHPLRVPEILASKIFDPEYFQSLQGVFHETWFVSAPQCGLSSGVSTTQSSPLGLKKLKHFDLLYLPGLRVDRHETAHEATSFNKIKENTFKKFVTGSPCPERGLKMSTHPKTEQKNAFQYPKDTTLVFYGFLADRHKI